MNLGDILIIGAMLGMLILAYTKGSKKKNKK